MKTIWNVELFTEKKSHFGRIFEEFHVFFCGIIVWKKEKRLRKFKMCGLL